MQLDDREVFELKKLSNFSFLFNKPPLFEIFYIVDKPYYVKKVS